MFFSLARKENWSIHVDGDLIDTSQDEFSSFYTAKSDLSPDEALSKSPSTSKACLQTSFAIFSSNRSLAMPSCLERTRWKAIYLRNLRISNNWHFRRPNAVCHLRGHDEYVNLLII
jgi:hypothetical protein